MNIRPILLTCSLALPLLGTSITQLSYGQEANASSQQGDEEESKKLFSEVARGVGEDKNSAIQDALKNAVQQGFGVFVESKESLTDGKFSEEILTNSRGYIESYDITSTSIDDGVFHVTLHTRISSTKVVAKLKSANIPVKSGVTEVVLNLNEKLNKRLFERDRNAREAELLYRAWRDMPRLKDYVSARIVSAKEVDHPTSRDSFSIQTKIRYQYDWDRILTFNRKLDRFLQLSGVSKSSKKFNAQFNDLALVTYLGDGGKVSYRETRYIELPVPDKSMWVAQDDFFPIPVLTNLKLNLPERFPESGYDEKIKKNLEDRKKSPFRFGLGATPVPKEITQSLKADAFCEWTIHKINEEVWEQVSRKFTNTRDFGYTDTGYVVPTAYGKKPYSWDVSPSGLRHYFRQGQTAPIEFDNRGLNRINQKFKIGDTHSIFLSIDDLKKTAGSAIPSKAQVFSQGKPIPWRESVRLTWEDGSELTQPLAKWETIDGKSYSGRLQTVREGGQVVVIQLLDSTELLDVPVAKLTKESVKNVPVSVIAK